MRKNRREQEEIGSIAEIKGKARCTRAAESAKEPAERVIRSDPITSVETQYH